jgi:hypothetical protein
VVSRTPFAKWYAASKRLKMPREFLHARCEDEWNLAGWDWKSRITLYNCDRWYIARSHASTGNNGSVPNGHIGQYDRSGANKRITLYPHTVIQKITQADSCLCDMG